MEKQATVVVAEGNESFRVSITAALQAAGYQVVGTASDGRTAEQQMITWKPDVVILDLLLPQVDEITAIKTMPVETRPRILALAAFATDYIASAATKIGADYLMLKPCSPQNVVMRITEILGAAAKDERVREEEADNEAVITDILHEIGIPSNIKGFQYLREAIVLAVKNRDIVNAVTKELYPEVANVFCTTPTRVERAIRHAIEVAWKRGDLATLQQFFGNTVSNTKGRPTNSEFIALIADRLLLQSHNGAFRCTCYSSTPFLCTNTACAHRCR